MNTVSSTEFVHKQQAKEHVLTHILLTVVVYCWSLFVMPRFESGFTTMIGSLGPAFDRALDFSRFMKDHALLLLPVVAALLWGDRWVILRLQARYGPNAAFTWSFLLSCLTMGWLLWSMYMLATPWAIWDKMNQP